MKKPNHIYKVFLIVFPDAETRIVREIYRSRSNKQAKMYKTMYRDFLNDRSEVMVLGTLYDSKDCLFTIRREEVIDDLPF